MCLLIGVGIGGLNGFLILKVGLSGFMVTLGMLTLLRGLQLAITEGKSLIDVPESFLYLGSTTWLGLPAAVWICVVCYAVGHLRAEVPARRPFAVRDRRQLRGGARRRHPGRPGGVDSC